MKRYNVETSIGWGQPFGVMEEDEEGEYVKYEDTIEEKEKLAAQKDLLFEIRGIISNIKGTVEDRKFLEEARNLLKDI